MKIDLGNFGYQQREAASAQINRGDPTVMANAMQRVAQTNLEQASRANQAWNQVGQGVQKVGQNITEAINEHARLEATNNLQKAQIDLDTEYQRQVDRAQKGEINSSDIMPALQKYQESYKLPEVSGLGPTSSARYQQGLTSTFEKAQPRFLNLASETHRTETKILLDTNAEQHITNAINNGMSPEAAMAYFDTEGFERANREANGAGSGQYKHAYQQKLLTGYVNYAIHNAKDSNSQLASIGAALNDPHSIFSMMDVEHKLSAENTMGSYTSHNDAKAAQAQAHADALHRQAESNAMMAYNDLHSRILDGQNPAPEDYARANSFIHGTNVEAVTGGVRSLQQFNLQTQVARTIPPDELDSQIEHLSNKLESQGGTEAEYKQRDAWVSFRNNREKQLSDAPVKFVDGETRTDTPILRFEGIRRDQDTLVSTGRELDRRTQKLTTFQGRYGDRLQVKPLNDTELRNFQGQWEKAGPSEKVGLLADLRSSTRPETYAALTRQLKDIDPGLATIAANVHTSQGMNIAKDYYTGSEMIKKGAINAVKDEAILSAVDSHVGDTFTPSQKLDAVREIKPILTARGITDDNFSSSDNEKIVSDALAQTQGTRVKLTDAGMYGYGSTNVAWGMTKPGGDPTRFARSFRDQMATLPPRTRQELQNGLDAGKYYQGYDSQGHVIIHDGERILPLGNNTNYLEVDQ